MFFGCKKLINIDISQFDLRNVGNMKKMFGNCSYELKQKVKKQNQDLKKEAFKDDANF